MIPNTFLNRFKIILVNFTMFYLFGGLAFMGLIPVSMDRRNNQYELSLITSLYSFCSGCVSNSLYLWHIIILFTDPHLKNLYPGVGVTTATLLYLCSFLLMTSFYGLGFVNRAQLKDYYNRTKDLYNVGFSSFYGGHFGKVQKSLKDMDSLEEIDNVYMRLFTKVVVVNSLILLSIGIMAIRAEIVTGVSAYHFALFHAIPYIVKSLCSSFLYLHGCGTDFMFFKMKLKLLTLREELKVLTEGSNSIYEKMSKFCHLSDVIDHLGVCFDNINGLAINLTSLFKVQIVLVLAHSIILTIHELFTQYQAISRSMRGLQAFDPLLLLFSIAYIILVVIEVFLIVNVTDAIHSGSLRIGKTLQSLLYFEDIDVRLKQSVRNSRGVVFYNGN